MFTFVDRLGNRELMTPVPGDRAETLLLRNHIPPASVIVLRDGQPVSDLHTLDENSAYEAHLIEGYDLGSIRRVYESLSNPEDARSATYVKKSLGFSKSGALEPLSVALTLEEQAEHVENTVVETCSEFNLIRGGDGVLLGLSGGVDSSSLLLALAAARPRLPQFRLAAVTFEDFDSRRSPTFKHASDLAQSLGVEHHLAPAGLAEEIFNLNTPLLEVLPRLMETSAAHFVMYIDHHTTRRTLEVFAERNGLDRIALGLHTTDLVAGLLNGWMTGYNIASLPLREVGESTYIYPLAFVHKRELHLYHLFRTGALARHASPNAWERNPTDRNYYYYLSDLLQSSWPGLETMLFTAHNWRVSRQPPLHYEHCRNCGSALLHQPFTPIASEECDACTIFRRAGFIN